MEKKIADKIASIDAVADELPGIVIIHNIKSRGVEYMSPRGLSFLGTSLDTIRNMSQDYNEHYFNPDDAKDYVPKIFGLLERNNNQEIISFFQQVRPSEQHDWSWHLSTTKIFMRDDEGSPLLTITFACPIDPLHHITTKVSRLLEENNFLRNNHQRFKLLSRREREVLALIALGKSAAEIAESLFISVTTVETHRRNIKQKLQASSSYELSLYARAFDLI
jgi:DNA-binding CsgD family transcriptional regulator